MFRSTGALFADTLKMHLKQLYRSLVMWLTAALFIAYTAFSFIEYSHSGDPFNMIYRTRYSQFFIMLLAMVTGLIIGDASYSAHFDELESSIKQRAMLNGCAMLTAVLLSVSAYFFLYAALFVVIFVANMSSAMSLLGHCLNYLVLYAYIPSCTMALVGAALSVQTKSYGKYAVALLVWLFLSPVICVAGQYLFSFLQLGGETLDYLLHIFNQGDMIYMDNPSSYTLHTDWPRYAVRLAFLAGALIYFFLAYAIRRRSKAVRAVSGAAVLAAAVCAVLCSYNSTTNRYYTQYIMNAPAYALDEDSHYYWSIRRPDMAPDFDRAAALPEYSDEVSLKLVSSDISLSLHAMGTSFICRNAYEVEQPAALQTFTLYRGFDVTAVRVNGVDAAYERSGDYLSIALPQKIAHGEMLDIELEYDGLSSSAFPATDNLVFLPSNYAYLPQIGYIKPSEWSPEGYGGYDAMMMYGSFRAMYDVDYTLTLDTDMTVYTNLDRDENGRWHGVSDSGVTIVASPILESRSFGEYTLYAPQLVLERGEEIVSYYERFVDMCSGFLEYIDAEELGTGQRDVRDIVLTPTSPGLEGISLFYTLNDFEAVYQGTYYELFINLDNWNRMEANGDIYWMNDDVYTKVKTWLNELPCISAAMEKNSFNGYVLAVLESGYAAQELNGGTAGNGFMAFEDHYLYNAYLYQEEGEARIEACLEASDKLKMLFADDDKAAFKRFTRAWFDACMHYETLDMTRINELLDAAISGEGA